MIDGIDYTRVAFGQHARRVPAWLYIQDAGDGVVSFCGGSSNNGTARPATSVPHPLRYGSERTHQLIVGELIVRPQLVVASDAFQGYGLAGLLGAPVDEMLRTGDRIIDIRPIQG
jgi:hypothetical protein